MPLKLEPNVLLAKSFDSGKWKGSYGLVGHTADVVNAVTTLVNTLGELLIQQFGLKCGLDHLLATSQLAAFLHDWGKANEHFQMVVRGQRNPMETPQLIRHEAASVLLAWEFRDWLGQAQGDFWIALAAAGGHHLKLGGAKGKQTDELLQIRQCGDDRLNLYTYEVINGSKRFHPRFKELLRYGIKLLNLPRAVKVSPPPSSCWSIQKIKEIRDEVTQAFLDRELDPVLTAVVKGLLISGDAIGSALPVTNLPIKQWIEHELSQTLTDKKLGRVIDARLQGKSLRPFQRALGESQSRVTLARAGCGTGKTLGAYHWARSYALGRKLFFCYPTTGTSTEGFIDYVHNQVDSALLHSRAEVDLARWEEERRRRQIQEIYSTGEEQDAGEESENETAKKLDAFKAWGKEVNICTVDTVLGLLQCNRRPLYCFPAIASAAFVFDEVHCFDDRLFGALLRFLEVVKAPILLMSASFLPWQRQAISAAVGEPIDVIEGPKDLEEKPRYEFRYSESPDWDRVVSELKAGGKVLWVCNQVNTAIDVYREAKHQGLKAVLYHSRFRYEDRVKHHRAVVDAFKPESTEPILAIATQVAEMSLDLSATLLVSQIADPAGLIQRLGRLNRQYCGHSLEALFYPDGKPGYPYSRQDLDDGLALVNSLIDRPVCQSDLAQWLENSGSTGQPQLCSVLLDGEWRTYSTSLREEGHNVTALLEKDLAQIRQLPAKELPRYTIPLPNQGASSWPKHKFYPLAPRDLWGYSFELGAYSLTQKA